jgi:signal transduction histidine kinase
VGTRFLVTLHGLLLAALLAERRRRQRAQATLQGRLRFERLLADLGATFARLRPWEVGPEIENALGKALEVLDVDRVALAEFTPGDGIVRFTYRRRRPGIPVFPDAVSIESFPWLDARLRRGEPVTFVRPADLPEEAATDRRSFQAVGTRSLAAVPLMVGGAVVGALRFGTTRGEREWSAEFVEQLHVLAEIFGSALARRQADDALRESEARYREVQQSLLESTALRSAIFGSLYGQVAAIDAAGVIIAVNEAWTAAVSALGADPARTSVGTDYLAVCRRAAGDADAQRALGAIEAVLQGRTERASIEYPCPGATGERWFEMVVDPLRRPEGGAVIAHIDVTARRRAEAEVRAQREELAHALRLTTLGELVASLSHEMTQPLTAIISSAQAARRLLDQPPPGLDEVQAALDDIVEEGKRAAKVIRRLRALFRKAPAERKPVDLDDLVAEVVGLVRGDAGRRGVSLRTELAGPLPPVPGDRVQLQQVVLNLLLNALDAMAAVEGPGEVVIATTLREGGIVELTVRDAGVGVEAPQVEKIFESFVSTKPQGLGLGLSISRSIVVAHGGRIWATPNPDRGLTVHVELATTEPAALRNAAG